jgi:hypothetical protein
LCRLNGALPSAVHYIDAMLPVLPPTSVRCAATIVPKSGVTVPVGTSRKLRSCPERSCRQVISSAASIVWLSRSGDMPSRSVGTCRCSPSLEGPRDCLAGAPVARWPTINADRVEFTCSAQTVQFRDQERHRGKRVPPSRSYRNRPSAGFPPPQLGPVDEV